MRLCDICSIKIPRFRPRIRKGNQMVCDGCANGAEGRPVGYHGAIQRISEALVREEPDQGAAVFARLRAQVAEAGESWVDERMRQQAKLAHDSGDGATIYHCFACGGGQVVAGSDGSCECLFCKVKFTVQVQPEHSAMPQTIDGAPQDIPGMPGQIDSADPGATQTPGDDPAGAQPQHGGDAFIPPDAFGPPPDDSAVPPAAVPPKAAAKANFKITRTHGETALYINAEGTVLPAESYIRHLAIAFADDPSKVIAQVREEHR